MPSCRPRTRAIIWDFDGTLGYRDGGMWSASLLEVIRAADPSSPLTLERVRPLLRGVYPWDRADTPHPQLSAHGAWWREQIEVLAGILRGLGYAGDLAERMAEAFPAVYLRPEAWRLFPDALPTLGRLTATGWQHHLLSNHVPELREIVGRLGLAPYLSGLWNSAETGYEKPHPASFGAVLEAVGPAEAVWMVGDNPMADVAGAEAAGIPAILVRTQAEGVRYRCEDLTGVIDIVNGAGRA